VRGLRGGAAFEKTKRKFSWCLTQLGAKTKTVCFPLPPPRSLSSKHENTETHLLLTACQTVK
jgi:hypothetical protein